jgi:hypothetical protein
MRILKYYCAALVGICAGADTSRIKRTITVDEGTNIPVAVSPDRKTIVMDLQERCGPCRSQAEKPSG